MHIRKVHEKVATRRDGADLQPVDLNWTCLLRLTNFSAAYPRISLLSCLLSYALLYCLNCLYLSYVYIEALEPLTIQQSSHAFLQIDFRLTATLSAADKGVESFGKDYKAIVKEAIGKKKALTTIKIRKEAAKQRDFIKAEGKHLYALLKYYYCL